MKLAANADVGFIRGADQAYYRLHPENMRKGYSRVADLRERRAVYETVHDRYGQMLPSGLPDVARRRLAREALWDAGRAYGWAGARRESVDELIEFALDCWPGVRAQPLYRTLQSGRRIGSRSATFMVSHKAQWWLRRRSWKYRGI
jgi:hypothetical protein